jgi:competence protein ComEA
MTTTLRLRHLFALALLLVAPFAATAAQAEEPTKEAAAAVAGQVNINAASAEELALLPHVGAATAQRILEHREKNGAFKAAEDLLLVRGIGEKTFDDIRPYVSLSGKTTLESKVKVPRKSAAPAK